MYGLVFADQASWAESFVLSAYSGSRIPSPSIASLMRATVGLKCPPESYMTLRERFDFVILVSVFASLLAASVIRSSFLLFTFVAYPHHQHQHVFHFQFTVDGMYHIQPFCVAVNLTPRSPHTVTRITLPALWEQPCSCRVS